MCYLTPFEKELILKKFDHISEVYVLLVKNIKTVVVL